MGLVYNAITPSGTNTFKGQGSYRLQRQSMVELPFFTPAGAPKPPTDVNVYTFDLGGPIVKNKTHFFGGYEHTERDLSGLQRDHDHAGEPGALGLTEPAYMPRGLNTEFAIGKIDHQLSAAQPPVGALHVLRQLHHRERRRRPVVGAARERLHRSPALDRRAVDLDARRDHAERVARAVRDARAERACPNALSGTGPAINITGVANFGGPVAAVADSGFGFTQNVSQVNDSTDAAEGQPRAQVRLRRAVGQGHARLAAGACSTPSRPPRPISRRASARTGSATRPSRSTSACRTSPTTRRSTGCSCRTTGGCRRT